MDQADAGREDDDGHAGAVAELQQPGNARPDLIV
jgi:hypothetical protein